MQHDDLNELLIRIICRSCAIEEEYEFFQTVLIELCHYSESRYVELFMRNRQHSAYKPIAVYVRNAGEQANISKWQDLLLSLSRIELPQPIVIQQQSETQLLLPLKCAESQSMALLLTWKDEPPSDWVTDNEAIMDFSEKLAGYLLSKCALVKIATAKEDLESLFDHLPIPISVINSDLTIERVNKAYARLFNITFAQVIGKECYHGSTLQTQCRSHDIAELKPCREAPSQLPDTGKVSGITFLPFIAKNSQPKTMQFFQGNEQDGIRMDLSTTENYDFMQVYNNLSQPLTVLSLMTAIIESNSYDAGYLESIRRAIDSIKSILNQAHRAFVDIRQNTISYEYDTISNNIQSINVGK